MVQAVNSSIIQDDAPANPLVISSIFIAATDAQVSTKVTDKKGVILVAKMPPSTSDIQSADDYSEDNQCLLFILERQELAGSTQEKQLIHYDRMQRIMKAVKSWILEHGLNNDQDDGEETISKPFRTEWEYQVYGNFNGLSLGFDLKDFSL